MAVVCNAKQLTLTALILPAFICGCAGLEVKTIGIDEASDRSAHGFRYFQPAPFLFVHTDGKGGLTSEVVWLPDTSQKMSVRPYAWLASNNAALKFSNGMLTEGSSTVDETVVPAAILSSLAALAPLLAADLPINPSQRSVNGIVPPPYLYRIYIKHGTISLNGGPPLDPADGTHEITVQANLPANKP